MAGHARLLKSGKQSHSKSTRHAAARVVSRGAEERKKAKGAGPSVCGQGDDAAATACVLGERTSGIKRRPHEVERK